MYLRCFQACLVHFFACLTPMVTGTRISGLVSRKYSRAPVSCLYGRAFTSSLCFSGPMVVKTFPAGAGVGVFLQFCMLKRCSMSRVYCSWSMVSVRAGLFLRMDRFRHHRSGPWSTISHRSHSSALASTTVDVVATCHKVNFVLQTAGRRGCDGMNKASAAGTTPELGVLGDQQKATLRRVQAAPGLN